MKKKFMYSFLSLVGVVVLCFITMAPIQNGNLSSKVITIFSTTVVTGTSTITSNWFPIEDSQYFGYGLSQTGTTPSITVTYDQSFDGTNVIGTVGTITTSYASTTVPIGGSISPPVAPLIRFNVIGQAGNGTSTPTLRFMRQ